MASVVTVPVKASRTPAAVLLTKQDFEQLRNHALSPSKDFPRCIPISAPLLFGEAPDMGNALSAATGKSKDKIWPEKAVPHRRSRSASGRRPPQLPPRPHSDPLDLDSATAAAAAAVTSLAGASAKGPHVAPVPSVMCAVRPHALKAQTVASRVRKDRLSAADGGTVDRQRGQTPPRGISSRQPSRQPPSSASRSNSRGVGITTLGCGSPHGGHSAAAAVNAASPNRPSATASRNIAVAGFDPRRPPRPADLLPARAELPISLPPGQTAAIIRMGADNQNKFAAIPIMHGLSVSGQAATAAFASSETPETDAGLSDLKVEDWTSSEEEGCAGEEIDTVPFYYRDYRYQRNHVNQEPPQRGRSSLDGPRRRARRVFAQPRDESSDSGYSSAWSDQGELTPRWRDLDAAMTCGNSRSSTPYCELEEGPDDELCRVAEALVKFYGLPGGVERAVRLKCNSVMVNNEAWAKRQRESNLEVAPTIWVRGGRVYDFHGDRGTVDEFEHDLLGRQVEDDSVCRGRRREQGLMPFPFVALPMKREEDPDERDDDNCAGAGIVAAAGGGRRRHWL